MTNAHVVRPTSAAEHMSLSLLCTSHSVACGSILSLLQVSNETTVHVRRPGNPKKWRAKVLCEGNIADLALVTVEDDQFWTDELLDLQLVDVPELQASIAGCVTTGLAMHICMESGYAPYVQPRCFELFCNGIARATMQYMQQPMYEPFTPLELTY